MKQNIKIYITIVSNKKKKKPHVLLSVSFEYFRYKCCHTSMSLLYTLYRRLSIKKIKILLTQRLIYLRTATLSHSVVHGFTVK